MKKLAFTTLYALCFTVMTTGITFAAAQEQETGSEKAITELQETPPTEQDLTQKEQQGNKKTRKEVRDAVENLEKERCQ
jgi:hypothetical protein